MGKNGEFMAGFHGRFDYTIDSKGRVNIPAKFRSMLNPDAHETFTIFRAPGGCLRAYPKDRWDVREAELESRPETEATLKYKRLLYNTLTDSTLDSQGRISLSAKQITIGKITKEITLVGESEYIEIWNTAAYDEYLNQNEEDYDSMFYSSVENSVVRK